MYLEYLILLIPIILSLLAFVFFKHKLVWWELLLPIISCLILIIAWSSVVRNSLTNDKEYWSDTVIRVEFYEKWDEYIDQTCTRECCCSTDSKGNTSCSTEYYDCSYIDVHPEYWQAVTKNNWKLTISKKDYIHFQKLWNNSNIKDLKRDYYSIDGDMNYSIWDNNIDHSLSYFKVKTYENKTQAALSNFKFQKLDTLTIHEYSLYNYPEFKNSYNRDFLLGYDNSKFEKELAFLNGKTGPNIQLINWIIIFKNKPINTAYLQENYWMGGNKNEAVLCISINSENKIQWAKSFSWTEESGFIYDLEHIFEIEKTLDSQLNHNTINKLELLANSKWKRKEFSDFNYITIPLPINSIILLTIVTMIISIGLLIYGINNEFEYSKSGKIITNFKRKK